MITVSVLYPKHDGSTFDYEYYMAQHVPLVRSRWSGMGLVGAGFLKGLAALDGSAAAYAMVGTLSFDSSESMQAALAAHGAEIIGDIPNFTNVQPMIQVNEVLG